MKPKQLREYFCLQFSLINREIRDLGMNPVVGYVLGVAVFVAGTIFLFERSQILAAVVLTAVCIGIQLKLSEKNRTDFLNILYGAKGRLKIRTMENLIVSIPFLVALLIEKQYVAALVPMTGSIVAALISTRSKSIAIPTPFSKKPWEFAVGFRNSLVLLVIIYVLIVISLIVNNLNLGLVSVFLLFAVMSGFYLKPENEYYVWIFDETPKSFLKLKAWQAVKNALLLALPAVALVSIFHYDNLWQILFAVAAGTAFVLTVMLAKYSAFPKEIGLFEVVLTVGFFSVTYLFPPLIIAVPIYFYYRSKNKLTLFLDDKNFRTI